MLGVVKARPGPGHVALLEREPVSVPEGYVRLEVLAAGICGTDLHIEAAEYPSVPPVTMGHEVCGVVAEAGAGVPDDLLGRRVASETFYSTCRHCAFCRAGRPNLCPERRSIGTHVDGAFAESVVVPAAGLHEVPGNLSAEAAALSEPLACVCQSLLDPARIQAGDDVLVIGPGAIGQLAAQVARAMGASVTVRGTSSDGHRLGLASELGFATSEAGASALGAETVDVVVECSGSQAGAADALRATRPGGEVVQMGLRGSEMRLPYDLVCFKELHVSAGFASTPTSWRRAEDLLRTGTVQLEPLVTSVTPMSDWADAFAASRSGQGVKFVLRP